MQRFLALVGPEERSFQASKIHALRLFLLIHLTVQSLHWIHTSGGFRHLGANFVLLSGFLLCLVGVLQPHTRRAATAVAALLQWSILIYAFPYCANHLLLEVVSLSVLAFLDTENPEEGELALEWCKWLAVIVLFYSGLQKLFRGTYDEAEFLGFMMAKGGRFTEFFQFFVPAQELERLSSIGEVQPGAGPYAVNSPLLRLLSHAAYLSEIGLAALLLWPRARPFAAAAAIALVASIEIAAREFFFGCLFVSLLLLFFRRDFNRMVLPGFALFYLLLMVIRFVVGSNWWFN